MISLENKNRLKDKSISVYVITQKTTSLSVPFFDYEEALCAMQDLANEVSNKDTYIETEFDRVSIYMHEDDSIKDEIYINKKEMKGVEMLKEMQTIKFEDKGQDFKEWIISDGVIVDCQPSQSFAWVGKEVMLIGDIAYIRKGDEGIPINYKVVSVEETDSDYVAGFVDGESDKKNQSLYKENKQYQFGFNVAVFFKKRGN